MVWGHDASHGIGTMVWGVGEETRDVEGKGFTGGILAAHIG